MTKAVTYQAKVIAADPRPTSADNAVHEPRPMMLPLNATIRVSNDQVTVEMIVMRKAPSKNILQQMFGKLEPVTIRLMQAPLADVKVDMEGGGGHARGYSLGTGFIGSGKRVAEAVRFVLMTSAGWMAFETMEPAVLVRARLAPLFHAPPSAD
jgi:hypothetical protein